MAARAPRDSVGERREGEFPRGCNRQLPQIIHHFALFWSSRGWTCGAGQYVADLAKIHRPPLCRRHWTDHGAPMHSTVKPKQADDPHDLLAVAPDVVQVAPSGPGDPTDEELSSLLRAAARQRSDAQTRRSDGATGPSAPAVDTTFRPAAVNNVRGVRSSMRTRTIRGVIGFVLALCIVVGAAAWQSYGDAARQMVAMWVPQLARAPSASPQDSGLAGQPSPPAVQASELRKVSHRSPPRLPQRRRRCSRWCAMLQLSDKRLSSSRPPSSSSRRARNKWPATLPRVRRPKLPSRACGRGHPRRHRGRPSCRPASRSRH